METSTDCKLLSETSSGTTGDSRCAQFGMIGNGQTEYGEDKKKLQLEIRHRPSILYSHMLGWLYLMTTCSGCVGDVTLSEVDVRG